MEAAQSLRARVQHAPMAQAASAQCDGPAGAGPAPPAPPLDRSAAQPPPPRRSRGPADLAEFERAWQACAFDRTLNGFCLLMHGATQVVSLLAWSTLPDSERFQRLLSIAVCLALFLLPIAVPVWYDRRRTHVLIAFRIVFFAFPLLRKPRGIQKVLDDEPRPGARGLLADMVKLAWGSRLIAVLLATVLNPLPLVPLVPHLALQLYSIFMVRSNASLCASPMLRHPLTKLRIHTFHAAMHVVTYVLPGGVGQSMFPLLARSERPEAECEAFLSIFNFAVGLALPLFLLIRTEAPTSLRAWEATSERLWAQPGPAGPDGTGDGDGAGGGRGDARAGDGQSPPSLLERLEGTVEGVVRMLCGRSWLAPPEPTDDQLVAMWRLRRDLAGGDPHPVGHLLRLRLMPWERLFAWWLILALAWALCVATAA